MRCAVCAEFLYPFSLGAQCTKCKMLCHPWCMYSTWGLFSWAPLVPPCLKNSSSPSSSMNGTKRKKDHLFQIVEEEYKSHQWVPFLNLSANWCSLCGYSLSLGQGNQEGANRRCEACKITCHAQCQSLVGKKCDLEYSGPINSNRSGFFEPLSELLPNDRRRTREPESKTRSRIRANKKLIR